MGIFKNEKGNSNDLELSNFILLIYSFLLEHENMENILVAFLCTFIY